VLETLHKRWQALAREPPGQRFQNRFRQRDQNSRGRVLRLGAAVVLLALGVFLLVVPGPGMVFIAVGAALLAEESEVAARVIDRAELSLRELAATLAKLWKRGGLSRLSLLAIAAVLLGIAGWIGYRLIAHWF
jgi:hypothetical protein